MTVHRVAFVVAASAHQSAKWWARFTEHVQDAINNPSVDYAGTVVMGAASPDWVKSKLVEQSLFFVKERSLTDTNRNAGVAQALIKKVDWLYWFDDDTIHPRGTLVQMLEKNHPFVSGLYYKKHDYHLPVAFKRNENGSYSEISGWRRGETFFVDSVGMGCALIHKQVYEDILSSHTLFVRENYTVAVVPNDRVVEFRGNRAITSRAGQVVMNSATGEGYYIQPVRASDAREIETHVGFWPFYAMEYLRTEDHFFCELAEAAGHKPLLDSSLNCGHVGEYVYGRENYLEATS